MLPKGASLLLGGAIYQVLGASLLPKGASLLLGGAMMEVKGETYQPEAEKPKMKA